MKVPSPTTMALTTGVLVLAGKWSNEEELDIKVAVGIGGYAIGLSLIAEMSDEIASKLSMIVLLSVVFTYGHILVYNLQLTNIRPTAASLMGIKVPKRRK